MICHYVFEYNDEPKGPTNLLCDSMHASVFLYNRDDQDLNDLFLSHYILPFYPLRNEQPNDPSSATSVHHDYSHTF